MLTNLITFSVMNLLLHPMKQTIKSCFILLMLAVTQVSAKTDSLQSHPGTFNDALNAARKVDKKLLLYFTAEWCSPCKAMEKHVFTDKKIVSFIDSLYVFYKTDIDTDPGKALKAQFPAAGVPAFSIINSAGERTFDFYGYDNAENFVQRLKEGLDPESAPLNLAKSRYQSGDRSIDFLRNYLTTLEEYGDPQARSVYYQLSELSSPQQMKSTFMWTKMNHYLNSDTTEDYVVLKENKADFVSLYGKDAVNRLLANPLNIKLEDAALEGDSLKFNALTVQLKEQDLGNIDDILYNNEKVLLFRLNDYDEFIALIESNKYPSARPDKAERLIDGAATVALRDATDIALLQAAQMWINESLALKTSVNQYAIAGRLSEKLNDLPVALKFYEQGIAQYYLENPTTEMEPTGLQSLIEGVKAKINES